MGSQLAEQTTVAFVKGSGSWTVKLIVTLAKATFLICRPVISNGGASSNAASVDAASRRALVIILGGSITMLKSKVK